jgi:fibronectin-binding autotransporter adhesin
LNYAGKFDAALPHDGSAAPSPGYFHVDHLQGHAPADAILVPDAHFLFNADFKRSGVDLILSGDDREVVLHDYFKGEKRAALASPDGAHLTGDIVNALTGHVEISQAGDNPAAGQVIGHLTKLVGNATATRNGVSIILNNGDNVEKGDVVQSGSDSTVGITFIDGTVFGLSSNARMVLNEMVYDPNGSNNSSLMSLVAGTISFVAGQTAKHGDMKIDTPVATMGIRGTAVLVQIDFTIPGQAGAPNASFQVLVEPDGTTGSYVLFDKTTLQPIAMVNQAGQQININNGVISQSNAPLSPDVQKLIQDVFTQKFTDNSNTKQTSPFNDTLVPFQQGPVIKLADGSTATSTFVVVIPQDSSHQNTNGPLNAGAHIPGPPAAIVVDDFGNLTKSFTLGELVGKTGDGGDLDSVGGSVRFVDVNAGDQPTVKVNFSSFAYQNAKSQDVTGTLSALQLADIAATEVKIAVDASAGNKNNGSATWTYSIQDKAFDFLAAGEQLTLTYMVRVDNNFAPNNETAFIPVTITITGTNDAPVVTTSAQTVTFSGGTSVSGGTLTTADATSGVLSFQDADLTDTHTVSTELTSADLSGSTVPPGPLALFENALTASIAADSTGTGSGTIDWKLASLPVYVADFIPKGETLTLTYTVTVTDSQNATSTQTVTVEITGTDNPAVVWIATSTDGSSSGGFWSDGANWETGTVPTANDDAIIITDQLIGLTPSFPVTINAPAFAKSVTMNDFGDSPPALINLDSLTIGDGGLSLGADSILHNSGTITVAGAVEILDHSVVVNSGTLDLATGGDFKDHSSITNTEAGTIEVSGGTLNVLVDIANAGEVSVDSGATLALKAAAIDGGMVTINGAPVVQNLGDSEDGGNGVGGDGVLNLQGSAVLKNGTLSNGGQINVSGIGNAFDDETVTANKALEIVAGGLLLLELGSSIANAAGKITVDSTATLALNDATIDGGTVTVKGTLELEGSSFLKNGSLDNSSEITVSGLANALDGETVVNTETAAIDVTGVLTLDLGASIAGGKLTNSGTIHVESLAGATFDGVDVDNAGGAILVDDIETPSSPPAKLTLDGGTTLANGTLTIGIAGTLEVSTDFGATLSGVIIDNSGLVEVDKSSVLTLKSTTITGGTLTDYGTIRVTGSSDIAHADVSIASTGIVEAADGAALTIECAGAVVGITNQGTLEANGGELDLVGMAVTNTGKLQAIDDGTLKLTSLTVTNDGGTVSAEHGSTLDLVDAIISGGTVSIDGTLDATGTSAITDANIEIASTGLVEATDGVLTIDPEAPVGITNHGTLEANGGELDIVGEAVANTGTLQAIDDGILSLTSLTVINDGGTVSAEHGSTLDLVDAIISGGTVSIDGTLDATGTSAITDANIEIASTGLVEATDGVLTIDPDAPVGITNHGTLEAKGGELDIVGEAVANAGTLQAIDDGILKLASLTVTNDQGTVSAGLASTLDLVDAIIKGGTVDVIGMLDSSGTSAIEGATIVNTGVLEVTGGTLTIDAASHLDNKGMVEANGGTLIIDSALSGHAEITGASVIELGANSLDAYKDAEITFTDGSTGTLKIDHSESFAGTVSGLDDNTLDLGDIKWGSHTTVTFTGDATGGTLTIVDSDDPTEVAHIHLEGDYLGSSWSATSDGGSGTKITELPGTLSGLDAHGNAVEGAAITASITDGGEPVTDASYTFETSSDGGHTWKVVKSGASNVYTPTEADEGKQLKVLLSFTDGDGHHETSSVFAGTVQESPDAHPVILGETNPSIQTIILAESPIVLPFDATTNALGLPTETFDEVPAGSASNNGQGHGSFPSSALNALFIASGNAGVVTGSSSVSAPPFVGPSSGHQDTSHYLSVGANGSETILFTAEQNAFGLDWGSVDSFNTIQFYHGATLVASYSGADVSPLLATGGQGSSASNGYVEFKDLAPFDKVVLSSGSSNAFEVDNVSSGYISDSHIHLAEPITGTLTVGDDDVGDTLTASVTGPAVVKYNGSTTLPNGINVNALINPSAVTFDSVTSDGKADVLHWTYNPANPNLDFLGSGDTLTITFNAQVSDGHATSGTQALTITLTGTGSSVVNGTAQNDVFDHVGGGVTIFGHGGNDTFVFNANFGSATIGDFDVNHDTINFDHTIFNNTQAFLAGAQSANSGHDTIITDANHDKITLTGVTVAELNAHPNDFHLV